ncbi:MAG: 7-cyano-7-deazaguanine synthase QueC [Planctomycetaceae bacterium]|jgi:7-cyano-7-deazaguanine synthase|nr:7-cyano-7-deazaguanine synthase QueC [Planctomycetaceae bacterium]
MKRAVILLSGGLDSTTAAAIAKSEGNDLFALTIDYNQRHRVELEAARRIAIWLGVSRHFVLPVDLRIFGGSSLTDDLPIPKDTVPEKIGYSIPNTYVPARNTIFLSLALALAETANASKIYLGISQVDYSGYPDCRPEFLSAFSTMANLATKKGVENHSSPISIEAPLMMLSKTETIRFGLSLGVDYSLTHSCYDPSSTGLACGHCESCLLRLNAFAELGIPDPIQYNS